MTNLIFIETEDQDLPSELAVHLLPWVVARNTHNPTQKFVGLDCIININSEFNAKRLHRYLPQESSARENKCFFAYLNSPSKKVSLILIGCDPEGYVNAVSHFFMQDALDSGKLIGDASYHHQSIPLQFTGNAALAPYAAFASVTDPILQQILRNRSGEDHLDLVDLSYSTRKTYLSEVLKSYDRKRGDTYFFVKASLGLDHRHLKSPFIIYPALESVRHAMHGLFSPYPSLIDEDAIQIMKESVECNTFLPHTRDAFSHKMQQHHERLHTMRHEENWNIIKEIMKASWDSKQWQEYWDARLTRPDLTEDDYCQQKYPFAVQNYDAYPEAIERIKVAFFEKTQDAEAERDLSENLDFRKAYRKEATKKLQSIRRRARAIKPQTSASLMREITAKKIVETESFDDLLQRLQSCGVDLTTVHLCSTAQAQSATPKTTTANHLDPKKYRALPEKYKYLEIFAKVFQISELLDFGYLNEHLLAYWFGQHLFKKDHLKEAAFLLFGKIIDKMKALPSKELPSFLNQFSVEALWVMMDYASQYPNSTGLLLFPEDLAVFNQKMTDDFKSWNRPALLTFFLNTTHQVCQEIASEGLNSFTRSPLSAYFFHDKTEDRYHCKSTYIESNWIDLLNEILNKNATICDLFSRKINADPLAESFELSHHEDGIVSFKLRAFESLKTDFLTMMTKVTDLKTLKDQLNIRLQQILLLVATTYSERHPHFRTHPLEMIKLFRLEGDFTILHDDEDYFLNGMLFTHKKIIPILNHLLKEWHDHQNNTLISLFKEMLLDQFNEAFIAAQLLSTGKTLKWIDEPFPQLHCDFELNALTEIQTTSQTPRSQKAVHINLIKICQTEILDALKVIKDVESQLKGWCYSLHLFFSRTPDPRPFVLLKEQRDLIFQNYKVICRLRKQAVDYHIQTDALDHAGLSTRLSSVLNGARGERVTVEVQLEMTPIRLASSIRMLSDDHSHSVPLLSFE